MARSRVLFPGMLLVLASLAAPAAGQTPVNPQASAAAERGLRSIEEVIDLHAPRIVPRKLSAEEKARLPVLLAAIHANPKWADVEALILLAESGQKDAMLTLLKALKGPGRMSIYTLVPDAPLETWGPIPPQEGIAGRWAAEYWKRYGPDKAGVSVLTSCAEAKLYSCGVTMAPLSEGARKRLSKYEYEGKGSPPGLKLTIGPAYKGEQALRDQFDQLNAQRRTSAKYMAPQQLQWLAGYERTHPEVAEAAMASKAAEKRTNEMAELNRQMNVADARSRHQSNWQTLWAKANLTADEQLRLEHAAASLGDDYLAQFGSRYIAQVDGYVLRLCQMSHASCAAQREAEAKRQVQKADAANEALLASQRRDAAVANAFAGAATAPFVEVRNYDRGGNYIGTTTMTAAQAEIVGATGQ